MKEGSFPLDAFDVKNIAEAQRKKGRAMEAISTVRSILNISPDDYPNLSRYDLTLMLMATRIYVNSFNSLAKRANNAPEVAAHLNASKTAITQIYQDPHVKETAPTMHYDIDGNPYEFSTAIARDEAGYLAVLANLTGNPAFLTAAAQKLDSAIGKAYESSEKTLAQFERDRLAYAAGSLRLGFFGLKLAYERAIRAAQTNNNWERVATIAARFTVDSLRSGHIEEARKAAGKSIGATFKDPSTRTILLRELLKAKTESSRTRRWHRTTPPDANYENLQIA